MKKIILVSILLFINTFVFSKTYSYDKIDSLVNIIENYKNYEEVIFYVEVKFETKLEKSRGIYSWIISNPLYKNKSSKELSLIYKEMCQVIDIDVSVIEGISKNNNKYKISVWNSIKIDSVIYLIDIYNGIKKNKNEWFLVSPDIFIETHYPINNFLYNWVLYNTKNNISPKELLKSSYNESFYDFNNQFLNQPITIDKFLKK